MRSAISIALLALLSACASVAKVESGQRAIGERMVFTLEGAWNQVSAPNIGPAQTWTMECLPVDQLLIYSGLKDGELVHAKPADSAKSKSFAFRSSMQPEEIVGMFEGMLTRDGSSFTLGRLEPSNFGGAKGVRFEYSVVRKSDNVQLSGVGYAAISKGELFALLYIAPRITFFPRHREEIEHIAHSALIKS